MKTCLMISMLSFLFLVSCSKNDAQENLVPGNFADNFKIERMLSEKKLSLQKQLYSLLSKEEKYTVWTSHMEKMQRTGKMASSQQKINLIRELGTKFTPETFEGESKDRDVFLSYHLPRWMAEAQKVFSAKEIYDIVESPNEPESVAGVYSDIPTGSDIGDIDCFCHIGNNGYSCKKMTMGFPNIISIEYGFCEPLAGLVCKGSSSGCGYLWLEGCNGAHCNY